MVVHIKEEKFSCYRIAAQHPLWWVMVVVDQELLTEQLDAADPLELGCGITAETPADERNGIIIRAFAHRAINLMVKDGGAEFDNGDSEQGANWTLDAIEQLAIRQLRVDQAALSIVAAHVRLPRESDLSIWKIGGDQ